MRRIKEEFLDKLEEVVPLHGLSVLEIGCGDGSRSIGIAERCGELVGIEPDACLVERALAKGLSNATFLVGSSERLLFGDETFDVVLFTLSFHHVPAPLMMIAIDEAVRVARRAKGRVVFLEPTQGGTFFDAELMFDACDGDERKEKAVAHEMMMQHARLESIAEIEDETVFRFDSVDDFVASMAPKKGVGGIKEFLEANDYILRANRRINIFRPL